MEIYKSSTQHTLPQRQLTISENIIFNLLTSDLAKYHITTDVHFSFYFVMVDYIDLLRLLQILRYVIDLIRPNFI